MITVTTRGVEASLIANIGPDICKTRSPDFIDRFQTYIALKGYRQYSEILKQNGYGSITGKPRISLLYAHGFSNEGVWSYDDGMGEYPTVQSWINQNEQEYSLLLIYACNRHNREIYSSKAMVIHPREELRGLTSAYFRNQMRLYDPSKGYLPTRSLTIF